MKFKKSLKENLSFLKKKLSAQDVFFYEIKIGGKRDACLIFVDSLTDKAEAGRLLVNPLSQFAGNPTYAAVKNSLLSPERKEYTDTEEAIDDMLTGNTMLVIDGCTHVICYGLKKFEVRAVSEPPTSTVIKGPREGFNETLMQNMALIRKKIRTHHLKMECLPVNLSMLRRRIKSPDLEVEMLNMGKYSKTAIALTYIKGVVQEGLVESVKERLAKIEIDGILDASYVSKFLNEKKSSLFKQVGTTEKPDILASKLLEGRIGIVVDGSPIALTLPYILIEDFQSPEDYYTSPYKATVARGLRALSVFLAVLLPGFFVAAQLFHLQLIPLNFLLTIVNSIKGIPLSPSFEMFFTLLIFEILNEASVRMPKYVGMVVSIVGGLVLGETAVNAGIISAPALMIIALSGICLYTVPELVQTFSLVRIIILILAGSLGGYSIILAGAFFLIYLVSFEDFKTPLLAPYAPMILHDKRDGFYKGALTSQKERPVVFKSPNKTRLKIKEDA